MLRIYAKNLQAGHVVTNHGPTPRTVQAVEFAPGVVRVLFDDAPRAIVLVPKHPVTVQGVV